MFLLSNSAVFFVTYLTLSCFTAPRQVQGSHFSHFRRIRCVQDIKLNVIFLQETVSMESNYARHLCKSCLSNKPECFRITRSLILYSWCITFVRYNLDLGFVEFLKSCVSFQTLSLSYMMGMLSRYTYISCCYFV